MTNEINHRGFSGKESGRQTEMETEGGSPFRKRAVKGGGGADGRRGTKSEEEEGPEWLLCLCTLTSLLESLS